MHFISRLYKSLRQNKIGPIYLSKFSVFFRRNIKKKTVLNEQATDFTFVLHHIPVC